LTGKFYVRRLTEPIARDCADDYNRSGRKPFFRSYAVPIYEYACKDCDAKFEQLQRSMSSESSKTSVKCPTCGSTKTARTLSVFAVGAEAGAKSAASASAPGMCGRCGGPGPCASGY